MTIFSQHILPGLIVLNTGQQDSSALWASDFANPREIPARLSQHFAISTLRPFPPKRNIKINMMALTLNVIQIYKNLTKLANNSQKTRKLHGSDKTYVHPVIQIPVK